MTQNPTEPRYLLSVTQNPTEPRYLLSMTQNPTEPRYLLSMTQNPTDPHYLLSVTQNPTEPRYLLSDTKSNRAPLSSIYDTKSNRTPLSAIYDTKYNTHSFFLFEQEYYWTLSRRNAANALRRRRAKSEKQPNSSLKTGPSSGRRWCRNTILRAYMQRDSHSSCWEFNCVWRRPSS